VIEKQLCRRAKWNSEKPHSTLTTTKERDNMFALVRVTEKGIRVVHTTGIGTKGSQGGRGVYNDANDAGSALYEFDTRFPDENYAIVPATTVATPVIEWRSVSWELDYDQVGYDDDEH
jgi:hypothetical protein